MDSAIVVALIGLIEAVGVVIIGGIITRSQKRQDAQIAQEKEYNAEMKALVDGMRTLLRNELVRMHREYVEEKGCISLEALEYAQQTYQSYHALRANGSGDKLWKDIQSLPIKD